MRILPLALAALLATGCVGTRQPDADLLPAVTLSEVNRTLEGQVSRVYFADGRAPVQGHVTVGPEATVIRNGAGVETVTTEAVQTVTLDVSMSPERGALHGAGVGATPGLLISSLIALNPGGESRGLQMHFLPQAILLATVGAGVGGGIGAATSTGRDDRVVYEAPVTRYPDAALALRTSEREILSPTGSASPGRAK